MAAFLYEKQKYIYLEQLLAHQGWKSRPFYIFFRKWINLVLLSESRTFVTKENSGRNNEAKYEAIFYKQDKKIRLI